MTDIAAVEDFARIVTDYLSQQDAEDQVDMYEVSFK